MHFYLGNYLYQSYTDLNFSVLSSVKRLNQCKLMMVVSQVKVHVSFNLICSNKSPTWVVKWPKGFWNLSTHIRIRALGSSHTRFASPCRLKKKIQHSRVQRLSKRCGCFCQGNTRSLRKAFQPIQGFTKVFHS